MGGEEDPEDVFATSYDIRCNTQGNYNKVILVKATTTQNKLSGMIWNANKQPKAGREFKTHPRVNNIVGTGSQRKLDAFSLSEVEIFADETLSEMILDFENTVESLKDEIVDAHTATDTINLALSSNIWYARQTKLPQKVRNKPLYRKAPQVGGRDTQYAQGPWVLKDGQKSEKNAITGQRASRRTIFTTKNMPSPHITFNLQTPKQVKRVSLYDNYFEWDEWRNVKGDNCPGNGNNRNCKDQPNEFKTCDTSCTRNPFRKGIHHMRVYLTNENCKGTGAMRDCSVAWSKASIEAGRSYFCGSAGADDSDEIFENYDVRCWSNTKFKRVVLAKQTLHYPHWRQCSTGQLANAAHDCFGKTPTGTNKFVATPVNKNWDGSVDKNTQPAVLKRISMSEVEIVAVESVNIAPKISEAYIPSTQADGYGGVEKLFDGIKEKTDPLTKKKLGRSDSFAAVTTKFPFIAVDLGFRTEISHVRITNNFGGIPDNRGDCSHTDENGNVVKDNWCYHYREGIAWTNVYLSNIAPSEGEDVQGAGTDCAKVWSKDSVVSEKSFWCGVVGNDQEDTLYDSWDQDCASSLAKFGAPGVKYQYVYFVKNTRSTSETTLYRGAYERFTGGANPQTNCDATCAANLAAAADSDTTDRASVLLAIAEPTGPNYATTRNEKALAISEIEVIAKETVSELLADLRVPVDEALVIKKYVNDACLQGMDGVGQNTEATDKALFSKKDIVDIVTEVEADDHTDESINKLIEKMLGPDRTDFLNGLIDKKQASPDRTTKIKEIVKNMNVWDSRIAEINDLIDKKQGPSRTTKIQEIVKNMKIWDSRTTEIVNILEKFDTNSSGGVSVLRKSIDDHIRDVLSKKVIGACMAADESSAGRNRRRSAECPPLASSSASKSDPVSAGTIAGVVIAVIVVVVVVALVVVRSKKDGAVKSTNQANKNNISFENPMYSAASSAANSDEQKENPLYDDADMDEHDDLYDDFDASKGAGESKYDEFEGDETGDIYDDNVLDEEDAEDAGYLDVDAGEDAGYLDVDEDGEDGGIYDDF